MTGKFLLTGGYVATLDDSLGDFPSGAVLVEDGTIKAVGKVGDFEATGAEIIDTTDGVVIPGMVDTHRHASMSLTRGIGADQALMHFLSNTYMRWLPATGVEDMHLSALVGALEALDSGVTTIIDTCESFHSREHAEAELQGLKDSGIRAFYAYGMCDLEYDGVPTGNDAWNARLGHLSEMHAANSFSESLVKVALQLSLLGAVPFELTAREIEYAHQHRMLCCSHSCALKNSCITTGIDELADNNLMLPGHVYIHCTNLTDRQMALVAQSQGKIAIAMETDMQMGMGIPPIRACLEHGIQPSLSIDTAAAVAPDLLSQMRLALQTQRCLDNEASHNRRQVPMNLEYTCRDALIWGTRNGADAVGLGDQIGTLTPGKRADIVFLSNKRFLSPSAFPLATAVLHSTPADVDTVLVNGVIRKREGQLVGQDVELIRTKAKEGLQRIVDKLETMMPEMTPEQISKYTADAERSSRVNLARAYHQDSRGDGFRQA
ncbi:uncharacterized protein APUU_10504S [Aspergillus puulaauensis]|uniref:Amidohydrolase-related domain-containing protein n=1 Tax=Aspergillus puulaauensis TaxID=1220207 RepID=A0A7R7XAA8_9EURO|nr:uncharacterized protein APUU_10504S [Aspergillus puulaauensis]BCS17676.1 hypothetical protein APUU_10504S [Aspergillus puulaauensis]